jgi:hypothetical protein
LGLALGCETAVVWRGVHDSLAVACLSQNVLDGDARANEPAVDLLEAAEESIDRRVVRVLECELRIFTSLRIEAAAASLVITKEGDHNRNLAGAPGCGNFAPAEDVE